MLDLTTYLQAGETDISNLLLNNYHKIGLTQEELVFYLFLMQAQQSGDSFPELGIISEKMGENQEKIFSLLQSLVKKRVLSIDTEKMQNGKTIDRYDLTLVYEKIQHLFLELTERKNQEEVEISVSDLYKQFEKEFGRPLSPIEMETIGLWLEEDKYSPEIIRLGLREAVLNQAYSLKYIDRILLSWERKNLKSKEQVISEQKKRKQTILDKEENTKDMPNKNQEDHPKIPLYNWLHPEKNKE